MKDFDKINLSHTDVEQIERGERVKVTTWNGKCVYVESAEEQ